MRTWLTKKFRFLCITPLTFGFLYTPSFLALVLVCGRHHYYLAGLGHLFLSLMSGYVTYLMFNS